MARAMWKGAITFGDVRVPVKLYAAVEDQSVHFHLLHASDHAPVRQQMLRPSTGEPIMADEVVRAVEVEPGLFVKLNADEIASLDPEPSRDIEVTRFVPRGHIKSQWYERPYMLGPDDDNDGYFALTAALTAEQREGVVRWVMRKQRYYGALVPQAGYLTLVRLRSASEVVTLATPLVPPRRRQPEPQELALAEQLVGTLVGGFDPSNYKDEYRARVLELVETKARGGTVALPEVTPREAQGSLAEMLRKSLGQSRDAATGTGTVTGTGTATGTGNGKGKRRRGAAGAGRSSKERHGEARRA